MRPRSAFVMALAACFTVSAACTNTPLRARRVTPITAATDLFGGSDATGGIGDWVLTNGLIQAIVDDVGYQADVQAATGEPVPIQTNIARSGGMLVDLGLYGKGDDQLAVAYPVLDYNTQLAMKAIPAYEELQDPTLGSIVPRVDAAPAKRR